MKEIQQQSEFERVIAQNELVFADFYTTWCEPCKVLDQVLNRISDDIPDGMVMVRVDSDMYPDLAERLLIKSAPVLFVFRNGEPVWRMNGFMMDAELVDTLHKVSRETTSGTQKN
jgi:thioredoxin 1